MHANHFGKDFAPHTKIFPSAVVANIDHAPDHEHYHVSAQEGSENLRGVEESAEVGINKLLKVIRSGLVLGAGGHRPRVVDQNVHATVYGQDVWWHLDEHVALAHGDRLALAYARTLEIELPNEEAQLTLDC